MSFKNKFCKCPIIDSSQISKYASAFFITEGAISVFILRISITIFGGYGD